MISHLSKIFEKIINNQPSIYLKKVKFLSLNQYGFKETSSKQRIRQICTYNALTNRVKAFIDGTTYICQKPSIVSVIVYY